MIATIRTTDGERHIIDDVDMDLTLQAITNHAGLSYKPYTGGTVYIVSENICTILFEDDIEDYMVDGKIIPFPNKRE